MNKVDLQNYTWRYWRGGKIAGGLIEVVDIDEIVAMSGFTKNSVRVFAGHDDFPSPVARMKRRLFWRRDDAERWIRIKKGADV